MEAEDTMTVAEAAADIVEEVSFDWSRRYQ